MSGMTAIIDVPFVRRRAEWRARDRVFRSYEAIIAFASWAIVQISLRILANYLRGRDAVRIAVSGLFFGVLTVLLFGQVFEGPKGVIVWTAAALALATRPGHSERQSSFYNE
jgi:hypothetical protein